MAKIKTSVIMRFNKFDLTFEDGVIGHFQMSDAHLKEAKRLIRMYRSNLLTSEQLKNMLAQLHMG